MIVSFCKITGCRFILFALMSNETCTYRPMTRRVLYLANFQHVFEIMCNAYYILHKNKEEKNPE